MRNKLLLASLLVCSSLNASDFNESAMCARMEGVLVDRTCTAPSGVARFADATTTSLGLCGVEMAELIRRTGTPVACVVAIHDESGMEVIHRLGPVMAEQGVSVIVGRIRK